MEQEPQYKAPSSRVYSMKKVLEKIKKKLEKLDALHEKEESIIESINEMIDNELEEDMDWDKDEK